MTATTNDVSAKEAVRRLSAIFGEPKTPDPELFFREYTKALKGVDRELLQTAIDRVLRGATFWPKPGEVLAEVVLVADARATRKPDTRNQDWTREALGTAYALIRSDMGREAADEGWVLSLWDFCRKHRRLPDDAEAHNCKIAARGFDRAYAEISGNPQPLALRCVALGDTMLKRRNRLARHAWGEQVDEEEIPE